MQTFVHFGLLSVGLASCLILGACKASLVIARKAESSKPEVAGENETDPTSETTSVSAVAPLLVKDACSGF